MRIIILVLVLGIIMYLVTRQIEEATPTAEIGAELAEEVEGGSTKAGNTKAGSTEDKKARGMYSNELNKARSIEQDLQDQLDKRMEEADALAQ